MKPIWESKTFWANTLTTAIGVLGVFAGADWIKEHPQAVSGIITAIGVLNVFLRTITSQPVKLS